MNLTPTYTKILILAFLSLHSDIGFSQIYKYKDEHGKWHFSDTKPKTPNTSLEELATKPSAKAEETKPFLNVKQANGKLHYTAHNPLLIPVQYFLFDAETKKKVSSIVLPARSSETFFKQQNSRLKREISFRYVIGDPKTRPETLTILPPFTDYKPMKITQSFNGKFSHYSIGNRFAIDIGMQVGTKITAVKDGIVFRTKDDYALAGVSSPFFIDKANLVEILHEDGTFALYGHLLLGGVHVKVGDKIKAGQVIGLSGNTGYSTGPHLHFVIRYNDQGTVHSIPFLFLQPDNKQISPKRGDWLMPFSPN